MRMTVQTAPPTLGEDDMEDGALNLNREQLDEMPTEVDHRFERGCEVTLGWRERDNALLVVVTNDVGDDFVLQVGPDEALEAFSHPFAYLDHEPIQAHHPAPV